MWIQEILGAKSYYQWIQFMSKAKDKIKERQMVDLLERVLCAITFAVPNEMFIDAHFWGSFTQQLRASSPDTGNYSFKESSDGSKNASPVSSIEGKGPIVKHI